MAKKAQKETHLQRLVKSLNTIGTAKTPVTNMKAVTKKPGDLPKRLQPKGPRGQHRRILIPAKIRKLDAPRTAELSNPVAGVESRVPFGMKALEIPTRSYLSGLRSGYKSFDPGSGTWDRRSPSFVADTTDFNRNKQLYESNARMYSEYRQNVKDVENRDRQILTAQKNRRLVNKIRNSKRNIGKVVTS